MFYTLKLQLINKYIYPDTQKLQQKGQIVITCDIGHISPSKYEDIQQNMFLVCVVINPIKKNGNQL